MAMGMRSGNNPRRLVGGLLLWGLCGGACAVGQAVVPLLGPAGLVFDAAGGVYVAETARHVVDRFDPVTGKFSVVAGNGTEGFSGDGGAATAAELDAPQGLALDAQGNLYLADSHNQRVRRVDAASGVISTVAGNGVDGFVGDGGAATAARLSGPVALAVDGDGGLLIADAGNHRVRRVVLATGVISTFAGNGTEGDSGDGGAATAASLDTPGGLAVDGAGGVLIADTHNHRLRRVVAGVISGVAGGVGLPRGVSVDAAGNVYVADVAGQRVLRIASGVVTVVAGTGAEGFAGDGGQAVAAVLDGPRATGVSPAGLVTVADTRNQRVRQVDGEGVIRTLAGVGPVGTVSLSGPAVVQYGASGAVVASGTGTGQVVFYEVTSGAPVALAAVASSGGVASYGTDGLAVGVHRLMAASADGESAVIAVTVTQAPVVATLAAVTTVYGQAIPALTGTLSGVLARDLGAVSVVFGTDATSLSPVGSYPVTATLTGAAAGNYTVSAVGAVVIGQAGTGIALTSSAGTVVSGTALGLSAKVVSVTQGVPTGRVSFLDGGVGLGTVALDGSGAAGMSAVLGVGTHTVTAVYAGDANFLGSASTGLSEVVSPASVAAADFALNPTGGAAQTVVGGAAAVFGFGVAVSNGSLSGPILLAVSGLPAGATASFNPALIPPGGAVTSFTLTIQTVKQSLVTPVRAAALLLGVVVLFWRRSRVRWLVLLGLLAGCGDRVVSTAASSSGAGPVSYPITVTGTSTSASGAVLEHTAGVTLTVQ